MILTGFYESYANFEKCLGRLTLIKDRMTERILKHSKLSSEEILEFKERYAKERQARKEIGMKPKCLNPKCRAPIDFKRIEVLAEHERDWKARFPKIAEYGRKNIKAVTVYLCDKCKGMSAYPVFYE